MGLRPFALLLGAAVLVAGPAAGAAPLVDPPAVDVDVHLDGGLIDFGLFAEIGPAPIDLGPVDPAPVPVPALPGAAESPPDTSRAAATTTTTFAVTTTTAPDRNTSGADAFEPGRAKPPASTTTATAPPKKSSAAGQAATKRSGRSKNPFAMSGANTLRWTAIGLALVALGLAVRSIRRFMNRVSA